MAWLTFAAPGGHPSGRGKDRTDGLLAGKSRSASARRTHRRRLSCERLEERTLLATPGVDYVVTGYSWPNPSHITYSIAPDGVFWDHGTNVLNSTFNAKFGTSGIWEAQIARALATWESVANINIVPVADGPYDENTLGLAQATPGLAICGSAAIRTWPTPRRCRSRTSPLPRVPRPPATSKSTPPCRMPSALIMIFTASCCMNSVVHSVWMPLRIPPRSCTSITRASAPDWHPATSRASRRSTEHGRLINIRRTALASGLARRST